MAAINPFKVISDDFYVYTLSSCGLIQCLAKENLSMLWQAIVEEAQALCSNGKLYAVCSNGKVFEVSQWKSTELVQTVYNLSCVDVNAQMLVIGCSDIPNGSLILTCDLKTRALMEFRDAHLGDITEIKFKQNGIYSSGVDGLVCRYDLQMELEQVFNAGTSVMSFDVRKDRVLILTDINSVQLEDNCSSIKYTRPSEEVFGLDAICTKKGSFVIMSSSHELFVHKCSKKLALSRAIKIPCTVQCAYATEQELVVVYEDNTLDRFFGDWFIENK